VKNKLETTSKIRTIYQTQPVEEVNFS